MANSHTFAAKRRIGRSAYLFAALAVTAAANPQYVGSAACRVCHAAKFDLQSQTGHARALAKASPGSRGQWAFGAGEKATTWVSQITHDVYAEHGLSFFAATKTLGLTPGHADANDVRYRTFDAEATTLRCFRCHSTGPLAIGAGGSVEPAEPGIHCESCHGPASEHVSSSGGAGTILNPKRLSPAALNDFCGVCHRKAPESDWTDKWRTRHQPSYLNQAACFRKSGTLSCLTCHDPHAPLDRLAADYDNRCIACHQTVLHHTKAGAQPCVACHMPQVAINAQLSFTNHWIGIYSKDTSLVPTRSVARGAAPLNVETTGVPAPAGPASLQPLFEQALAQKEKELGKGHPQVARGAYNLGRFISLTGNAADAEAPFRQALSIDEAAAAPEIAEDREALAQLLSRLGRNDEAFALFQMAAKASDPKISAEAFASLALLDPAQAEDYYRSAVDSEAKVLPKDPKHLAILLNDLAMALQEKRDYRGAESAFRNALAIQQQKLGPETPAAAATLSNLGSLLETAGKHQEAEGLEREAIRIFERKLGPWSAELATSCANLADILATKGELRQAVDLYRRALVIDETVYGADHPEIAADLVNLGTLLKQSGQVEAGKSFLRRALEIDEKVFGPLSSQAAQIRAVLN